ncbi:MAG: endonuclease/exonuclease/phosphatase family protein [Deltaproteobacteria bacterium]
MSSALVRRVATVTPYAALALLLAAWALCVWGSDESLPSMLATHLPTVGYCAIALGALVASFVVRSLAAGLAVLPCLVIALVPLGGWTTPSRQPAALSASHRVLTWNVEQWSHGGTAVARAIAELAPDVLCLQEAKSYASFPGDQEWNAFEAALPGYRLLRYGEIAIGTRWPVIEQRRVALHQELWRRPLLDVTLQTPDGGLVRVLNAHLVHTGYYGKRPSALVTSALTRRAQAEQILKHIGPDTPATILCGDLNAAPNSAVLSLLRERLSDAWRLRGHGFGMTSTARWPLLRIDYLLVSGIDVGEIHVLEQPLSDHRGLTATFALSGARPGLATLSQGP